VPGILKEKSSGELLIMGELFILIDKVD